MNLLEDSIEFLSTEQGSSAMLYTGDNNAMISTKDMVEV